MSKWVVRATAFAVVAFILHSFVGMRDAAWQARVETVMDIATIELARADSLLTENELLQMEADSLANEAAKRDTVIIRMVEELPTPAPSCEAFTEPRDRVIRFQEVRYGDLQAAYDKRGDAMDLLRRAEIAARGAADSLYAVLDDRPRPLSLLIPEVGVGAFAGVCSTGAPCAGIGFTLQWKVRLF